MVDTTLARHNGAPPAAIVEQVVLAGDLARLTPDQRVRYYRETCDSLGLNPLTQPFQYINLNGKLTLYCTRAATDQLRALRRVSLTIVAREKVEDLYVVTARATTPDGRTDESIGAVSIGGLKGDALANAFMKAETKAKRRVTLAVVGLGWLDESETGSIAGAQTVSVEAMHGEQPRAVDRETGEIVDERPPADAPAEMIDKARALYVRAKDAGIAVRPPAAKTVDEIVTWTADVEHRLASINGDDPEDVEAGVPAWADTALGGEVMALAAELTDVKARYQLPPNDATEADLQGWLASKRGLLKARRGN